MLQSYGQSKGTIIMKDGLKSQGFIDFDPKLPDHVQFSRMRNGSSLTYNLQELEGFTLQNGKKYAVKTVSVDGTPLSLFVEVIGDSAFFYLKRDKVFFKPSNISEQITEKELLPYLQSITASSAKWHDDLHLFKLKPNSLRYFAKNIEASKSPTVLFPSAGVFSSFNRSVITIQHSWLNVAPLSPAEATSYNIGAGAFADLPLWKVNNLSVQTEASYGKMRFNGTLASEDARYDYKVNLDFAMLSLLPKYSLSLPKFRVFAQAGLNVMHILESDSHAMEALTEGDNVWLRDISSSPIESETLYGLGVSAGISYFYRPKHYISLGISQNKFYSKHFNISNQSVTASINL
ncbi:hypothetical protein D1627_14045 [Pontibacter oryzae]|uniref:Uncharacterized protein n=1 Tax=Pontibacter oryzae TaxID=2304593 RepID=A0A399S0W8_9BACT|nr:hypothetical protein D1627_14045 [Pontibacter oryzae]